MTRLQQKTAIVTGGAGALGSVIAEHLHREGARIVLLDKDEAGLASVAQGLDGAIAMQIDLTEHDALLSAVDSIASSHGNIDILVNCSARFDVCDIDEITPESWNTALALNLTAPFQLSQAVARYMRAVKRGSIVNVSSVAAFYPRADQAAYCASKAALEHLTRVTALAYAADGIRVNTLRPGLVAAGMGDRAHVAPWVAAWGPRWAQAGSGRCAGALPLPVYRDPTFKAIGV